MIRRPSFIKKSLATYHPILYHLVVFIKRVERRLSWILDPYAYAHDKGSKRLKFRVKKHQSVLIKQLSSKENKTLQLNKIQSLKVVVKMINGLVIKPGETFSFCKLVGKPSIRRGFLPGIELSQGKVQVGVGGGICQASNLLYWLFLHTPLEIIERHHHSFDPFPDQGRILPFASGATVMYNYRDLRVRNNTENHYQINLWLDAKCLNGEIRCDSVQRYSYSVFEVGHRFEEANDKIYRSNQLWRKVYDRKNGGHQTHSEYVVSNRAEVKYNFDGYDLV